MKTYKLPQIGAVSVLLALMSISAALASTPDAAWIRTAASANVLEMKAGNLAAARESNPDWKTFAETMVSDHAKALGQIRALALDKDVDLPSSLLPADERAYEMLSRRHGASFDQAYQQFAVNSHVEANALYNHEINHGQDSDVRAVAAKQLPTVQNHLTMADQMTGMSLSNLSDGNAM
jgi:putative membrane protein